MLGGAVVVVAALGAVVLFGGIGSSIKAVTVIDQTPVMSASLPLESHGPTAREVYRRDAPGVVFVSVSGVDEAQSSGKYLKGEAVGGPAVATGSGFEIDGDGTIVTNWHVVQGAVKITVGVEHGRSIEASLIGKDTSHDVAILRIPTAGLTLHPLTLGDSSKIQVGDPVLAIGNPFGLTRTLTTGVISALERKIQAPSGLAIDDALQTDAPINPGNSGGPLLNEAGQVIGINSQIETSGEHAGNVGIAFAVPIDTAKGEIAKLEK